MYGEHEFLWRAFAVTGDPLAYLDYRLGSNDYKSRRRNENKKAVGE